MNSTHAAGALLASLLLGACATSQAPPAALVDARQSVRGAELDPAVASLAPLELKKATDSLARADDLLAKGEPLSEVSSAAYVADRQAKTAQAVARAKTNDAAVASSQVERERVRADTRGAEADRARAQTTVARQQTAVAQADAASAKAQADQLRLRLDDLKAQQTDRGMLVTLGDVLFEFNRAEVKPSANASLRKLADFLQQYPSRQVLIEGYTDNIGALAYNDALSLRRADAVDAALVGMGVASGRLATAGYGEAYPIADNASETNRALNRRVEVYIADNEQPVRARH